MHCSPPAVGTFRPSLTPQLALTAAELRQYYKDLAEFAEESVVEWSKIYDLGDQVLALGRISMRFSSGVELNQEGGCLYTWRNGKLLEARPYMSRAEALEAAGLRE